MPVTRKDAMAAIELQEKSSLSLSDEISQLARANAPVIENEWKIYKLVDTKRKGRVWIDGIDDDVLNPITGKRERIWLLSGSSSIWASDLTEQLKNTDWKNNNRRNLPFEGGVLRIPSWDTRALEFINVCRHLIDNPSRRSGSRNEFFEYNPAKQQKAALDKEMLELDMAIMAKEMEITKVRKLASFLGVVMYDDLGLPKSDDGVRRELMLIAKRDPKRFQENVDSKEVEVNYLIRKAIIDAKIDIGGVGGVLRWATGGQIAKMPPSRRAPEFLTELAMSHTDEGKGFLEQLQRVVK